MPASAPGNALHARGDRCPVVVGLVAHEVEALPNLLHGAADDAQRPEVLLRVVEVDVALQPVPLHGGGKAVVVVVLRRALERGDRVAGELHALGDRLGREVRHLVIVAGDAEICRAARLERGVLLHVPIGDVVHPKWF